MQARHFLSRQKHSDCQTEAIVHTWVLRKFSCQVYKQTPARSNVYAPVLSHLVMPTQCTMSLPLQENSIFKSHFLQVHLFQTIYPSQRHNFPANLEIITCNFPKKIIDQLNFQILDNVDFLLQVILLYFQFPAAWRKEKEFNMQQVLFETTTRCLTNVVLFNPRKILFTNLVLFETRRKCLTNVACLPCCCMKICKIYKMNRICKICKTYKISRICKICKTYKKSTICNI